MEKLFFIVVVIGIPFISLVYALCARQFRPFMLGVLAFVLSQIVIRIPLLRFVAENSSTYQLWNVTKPGVILLLLALTAGVAEECARWLFMRAWLQRKMLRDGVVFGLGHGGVEALLLVGLPIIVNGIIGLSSYVLFFSGMERLCAMMIHICLSVIVLVAVRKERFRYVAYAIIIHGAINFIVAYMSKIQPLVVVEAALGMMVVGLMIFTIYVARRNFHDEKLESSIK